MIKALATDFDNVNSIYRSVGIQFDFLASLTQDESLPP
jgi:hypothetical protein